MNKINIKPISTFFVLVILIPFWWSCENTIEFKGDEKATLMVVNALLTPDSVVKVHVSKSKFFLKDNSTFDFIDNATVKLFVNDSFFEQLSSIGNGFYTGTYIPVPGDKIRITSRSLTYLEVSAESEIVKPAIVNRIDTLSLKTEIYPIVWGAWSEQGVENDTVGYTYSKQLDIRLFLEDEPMKKNYYRVNLSIKQHFDNGEIQEREYFFNSKDLVFGSTDESGIFGEGFSQTPYNEFSDDVFNGKTYGLKLSTTFNNAVFKDNGYPKPDVEPTPSLVRNVLIIQLHSISESYFKYLRTISVSSPDGGIGMFSEPVQVFSNVEGGIGILGSYVIKRDSIDIPLEFLGKESYYQGGY